MPAGMPPAGSRLAGGSPDASSSNTAAVRRSKPRSSSVTCAAGKPLVEQVMYLQCRSTQNFNIKAAVVLQTCPHTMQERAATHSFLEWRQDAGYGLGFSLARLLLGVARVREALQRRPGLSRPYRVCKGVAWPSGRPCRVLKGLSRPFCRLRCLSRRPPPGAAMRPPGCAQTLPGAGRRGAPSPAAAGRCLPAYAAEANKKVQCRG